MHNRQTYQLHTVLIPLHYGIHCHYHRMDGWMVSVLWKHANAGYITPEIV